MNGVGYTRGPGASQGRSRANPRRVRVDEGRPHGQGIRFGGLLLSALFIAALSGVRAGAQTSDEEPRRLPSRIAPERAEVDLVLIDVVVRDRKGNPVPGLLPENFALRIDDRSAEISTFESYCAEPVIAGKRGQESESRPAESSSSGPSRSPERHIILFFDINQLSEEGRNRSVEASLRFVREQKADRDLVMLVAMKRHPMLLENFIGDRDRLSARLTAMLTDPEMIDRHYLEERLNMNDILNQDCAGLAGECTRRLSVAIPYAEEEMLRTKRSLDAVRNLMPALGALPGRKTLVHFSESLRDEPGLQYLILAGSSPAREGIDIRLAITELQKEANAAGVSLYMVWAAGLGEKGSAGMTDTSIRAGGQDTVLLEQALVGGEDASLALTSTLALETGGVATQRTNDLGLAFDAVEQDLSCYYVLGYTNRGPGDGRRHMIKVATDVKGARLRHRPYYEDWSEEERLNRRFRSALMAPGYFAGIPVKAEAYALAPEGRKTPILLKAEFPIEAVTVVRQPDGGLYGEAEVRTTVWTEGREACMFARHIPIALSQGEKASHRSVIYEAGCELPPGDHEFTVAVLDSGTWEMGAAGTRLPVPARSAGVFGDVVLWTPSGDDILDAGDAGGVGIRSSGSGRGFVPRAQRRFGKMEPGVLYSVVCPPERGARASGEEVRVGRRLFSGDLEVATFADFVLGSADDPEGSATDRPKGACEGIFSPIAAGQLGPGGYVFRMQIDGIGAGKVVHDAGIAVSEQDRSSPGS